MSNSGSDGTVWQLKQEAADRAKEGNTESFEVVKDAIREELDRQENKHQ